MRVATAAAAMTIATVLSAGGAAPASGADAPAVAVIEVTPGADGLRIAGFVVALADAEVTGMLTVLREGKAGTVNSTQGGLFALRAGERQTIAEITVSYEAGDRLDISAEVRQGDAVVARSTVATVAP